MTLPKVKRNYSLPLIELRIKTSPPYDLLNDGIWSGTLSLGYLVIMQISEFTYKNLKVLTCCSVWPLYTVKRQDKDDMYEAIASLTWHIVLQYTYFYKLKKNALK